METEKIIRITVKSKHELSEEEREFIAQLAIQPAYEENTNVVLHDIWEKKYSLDLIMSTTQRLIPDIVETIQDNLKFETKILVTYC